MEIVLGIDNVVFISVLVQRLPAAQRDRARTIGLGLAMGMRILLLLSISWIVGLTAPVFTIAELEFSWRDIILIVGGLFLIWKATTEIHEALEGDEGHAHRATSRWRRCGACCSRSCCSTSSSRWTRCSPRSACPTTIVIMVAAVVIAVGVMLFASGPISHFVHDHPTVKMLALSFLLLIGVTLIADGFGLHVEKGFVYAAMGFSVFVEILNLVAARRRHQPPTPVELHPTFVKDAQPATEG